jgi:hypothetical protein
MEAIQHRELVPFPEKAGKREGLHEPFEIGLASPLTRTWLVVRAHRSLCCSKRDRASRLGYRSDGLCRAISWRYSPGKIVQKPCFVQGESP